MRTREPPLTRPLLRAGAFLFSMTTNHIAFFGRHVSDPDPDLINPACVAWTPIRMRNIQPVGAVQVTDPRGFEVLRGERFIAGAPGDYLIRCASGEMFPVPARIFDVLFVCESARTRKEVENGT